MYQVTYGEPKHHARAYVARGWVFVGNVTPLTRARRDVIARTMGATVPLLRYDDLTIRPMVITDLSTGTARSAIDYTYGQGSGEWDLSTTRLINVH